MDLDFQTTLQEIPDAIMLKIFAYLPQQILQRTKRVSQRWRYLSLDGSLWRYCDFSSRTQRFLTGLATSAIIQHPHVIKITKTQIPGSFIYSALKNRNLIVLSLKESRLQNDDPKNGDEAEKRNIDETKCCMKFLDMRETVGDIKALEDYIFYEGHSLKELGLSQISSTLTRRKIASGMPFLRVLDCKECVWFDDRLMLHISKSCIHLEYLSVMRCLSVTGKYLPYLFSGCKKLKSLNLQRTRLSDATVKDVDWRQTNLEELDISHCYALDEIGLTSILANLENLRYLRTAVTDDVLGQMLPVAPKLEVFELRRRYPVKASCVSSLLCQCTNMTCLDISLTPVESKYFRQFLPQMPKLRAILFAGHEILGTSEILRELRRNCREIESVGINYYHANRDESLKDALISMVRHSPKLTTVALQGFFVERLVHQVRMLVEETFFCNQVNFISPMLIELPPMKNGLEHAFQNYIGNNKKLN